MINIIAAVNSPRNMYEKHFNTKPIPPLSIEVPSKRFDIQAGLISFENITPKPKVQTRMSELFRLNLSSSNKVIISNFLNPTAKNRIAAGG
jgi:hypothetical protein